MKHQLYTKTTGISRKQNTTKGTLSALSLLFIWEFMDIEQTFLYKVEKVEGMTAVVTIAIIKTKIQIST